MPDAKAELAELELGKVSFPDPANRVDELERAMCDVYQLLREHRIDQAKAKLLAVGAIPH